MWTLGRYEKNFAMNRAALRVGTLRQSWCLLRTRFRNLDRGDSGKGFNGEWAKGAVWLVVASIFVFSVLAECKMTVERFSCLKFVFHAPE